MKSSVYISWTAMALMLMGLFCWQIQAVQKLQSHKAQAHEQDKINRQVQQLLQTSYDRQTLPDKAQLKAQAKPQKRPSLQTFDAHIPSIWPTEGKLSSLFGMRRHPIAKQQKFHKGVDIANLKSTDIVATADGIVAYAGKKGGYGNAVIIDHGNGYKTLYGHAQTLLVKAGDRVQRGTLIAAMGSTGYSTGPHLHYEITFADEVLDPVQYVK